MLYLKNFSGKNKILQQAKIWKKGKVAIVFLPVFLLRRHCRLYTVPRRFYCSFYRTTFVCYFFAFSRRFQQKALCYSK